MSSNKKLLILSEGVMGQVAKDIAESMGCFEQVDILDTNYGNKDYDATYHAEAIGNISEYELFAGSYEFAIAAFEDSRKRIEWTEKLKEETYRVVSLVSSKAQISGAADIGEGSIIEALVQIGPNTSVGSCCFIQAGSIIGHTCVVGLGCNIENNCLVKPQAIVEAYRTLESGKVVSSYEEYMQAREHE